MEQTYRPIPAAWDSAKFETDYNCVAYAQDGELVVVSESGIDNLEAKIEANIAAYEEYLQNKTEGQAILETLGLTPAQLEALGL